MPRRSSQVCGQCHAFWEFADAASRASTPTRSGLPYRPGDDLAATRFIVQPTTNLDSPTMKALLAADAGFIRDIFWSDGMVRATGREYNGLIESPCFKNATDDQRERCPASRVTRCTRRRTIGVSLDATGRTISSHATATAPAGNGRVRCSAIRHATVAHTRTIAPIRRAAPATTATCRTRPTACSRRSAATRSAVPSVQATLETGRPNACNLCHLDKTLAWTAEYLERWYRIPRPALDATSSRWPRPCCGC